MRKALITFIMLSLVSLFADMTYEGARSVVGAYFEILGATAIVTGAIGIGEFLGYVMRGVGGFIAGYLRSSRVYWALIYGGYIMNLFAVPLLALTSNWETALVLVMLERIGKGLRTPARDVVLAEVTESIGRGKGFGLHELLDQVGAISGPAIVTYVMTRSVISQSHSTHAVRLAFAMLSIPALIAILILVAASITYPRIKSIEVGSSAVRGFKNVRLGTTFWLYIVSMSFLSLGYIHWSLFTYYVNYVGLIPLSLIPTLYMVSMGVDAIIAFPAGYIYDKVGPKSLIVTPILTTLIIPLLFQNTLTAVITAAIIWGIVMGIYETNMRVVIADIVQPEYRAYAYGVYGTIYGLSWGLGNVIIGFLYTINKSLLITYILIAEITSAITLLKAVAAISNRSSNHSTRP